MSNSTVLWFGPVNLAQVKGATVPGARARAVICTGNGSPSCGQMADALEDGDGLRLPALLQREGLDEASLGELVYGAFSAGGSAVKRLLMHEEDRARVRAVLLADATYTDWAAPGAPLAPEGFVRFCIDALDGDKLFVATASSAPNKSLPSGRETLSAIRKEVETRSGMTFGPYELPARICPRPVRAFRLGNVILADYGAKMLHAAHATALAAPIWQEILVPWLVECEAHVV